MENSMGQKPCPHAGYYSGVGHYSKDSQTLRYVLVCDECGKEMKEKEMSFSGD